jgi:hypothetical protein
MGLVGVNQTNGLVVPPTSTIGAGSWASIDLDRARLTDTGTLLYRLLGLVDMADDERDAVLRSLRGEAAA